MITGVFLALIIFTNRDLKRANSIKNIHLLSRLPSTVNSTPFLEKRVALYDDFSNRLYPQMSESTGGSFVYVK
jgi:hypothetical protein